MLTRSGAGDLTVVSRGSAVILLLQFVCYVLFIYRKHVENSFTKLSIVRVGVLAAMPYANAPTIGDLRDAAQLKMDPRSLYITVPLFSLAIPTIVAASIFLLESVHALTDSKALSPSFVGLVVMPFVLASIEYISNAIRSTKDHRAWIAETIFGSSVRISMFVFPLAVILGWITGKEMDMIMDGFQVTILTLTVLMVNHVIHNDFAHWFVPSQTDYSTYTLT